MNVLNFQDLLLLLADDTLLTSNKKVAKSITPVTVQTSSSTETVAIKPVKKRIGLMPIDKRVYELLDQPSDEFFKWNIC